MSETSVWIVRDLGDTWMARPASGALDADLTVLGDLAPALTMSDGFTSVLGDTVLAAFVLGDADDPV